jgi:hypothetical protein
MKKKIKYKSLAHTLKGLQSQTIESVPFCRKWLPSYIDNPEQLFYYLKTKTIYKHDPKGIELLQTAQTLINSNWHGVAGMGDCDCFTIISLACLHVIGVNNLYVVLVGNNSKYPSHIYCAFGNLKQPTNFDLTNSVYGYERPYKFKQLLPICI